MNIVPKDFVFDTEKTHAKLSKRGTAKLLKVDDKSIRNALQSADLFDTLKAQTVAKQGFEGADIIKVVFTCTKDFRAFDHGTISH